jgi:phosphate uptake regulator
MKRRITEIASKRVVAVRCSDHELTSWTRLAERKGKTISAMIRDGLNVLASRECLCRPGEKFCEFCRKKKQTENTNQQGLPT